MKEEVKIDWNLATDDQLAELYDALYERNALLARSLDSCHFRVNLGSKPKLVEEFRSKILAPSKDLADSVFQEVDRRRLQVKYADRTTEGE